MKKNLLSILLVFLSPLFMMAAEINTPLFATFEDGTSAPFELNADGTGSDIKGQVIADNPLTEKNETTKAIKIPVAEGTEWWHKTYLKVANGDSIVQQSENHKYLHIYVMYPGGGNGLEIGLFNKAGELIYQEDINFTEATNWQDVVFDLTADLGGKAGIAGNDIAGMWLRPYTGGGKDMYVDEFELSDSAEPRARDIINWNSETLVTFEPETESPFAYTIDGGVLDAAKANPDVTGKHYCNMSLG